MHSLVDYITDELKALERKAENSKLSSAEVQYGDMLAHFEKNLLTSEAMKDSGNSNDYSYDRRRDSMGRYMPYSRERDDLKMQLREMERNANDDESRRMIKHWMKQVDER